jgi:hypothetical protein
MKYENKDKVDKICNDIAAKTEIVHSLRDKFRAINIVDGIGRNIVTIKPDDFPFYGMGNPVRDLMKWHYDEIERLNKELEEL